MHTKLLKIMSTTALMKGFPFVIVLVLQPLSESSLLPLFNSSIALRLDGSFVRGCLDNVIFFSFGYRPTLTL